MKLNGSSFKYTCKCETENNINYDDSRIRLVTGPCSVTLPQCGCGRTTTLAPQSLDGSTSIDRLIIELLLREFRKSSGGK